MKDNLEIQGLGIHWQTWYIDYFCAITQSGTGRHAEENKSHYEANLS